MTIDEPKINPTSRYSITQGAAILGISRATMYNAMKLGRINVHLRKSNQRIFVTGLELLRYWAEKY